MVNQLQIIYQEDSDLFVQHMMIVIQNKKLTLAKEEK